MKKLGFVFLILSTLIFSVLFVTCTEKNEFGNDVSIEQQLDNRADGPGHSCLGETPYPCYDGSYSWYVVIPDYPNCEFIVDVDYYVCYAVGGGGIHMGDFEFVINIGCNEFYNDWDEAIQNEKEDVFYTNFNQQVWSEVTQNLLGSAPLSTWAFAEIEYNVGSCKFLCEREVYSCGSSCCIKENLWERNLYGDWELTEEGDIVNINGLCPEEPIRSCSPFVIQSVSCFDNCASLDF